MVWYFLLPVLAICYQVPTTMDSSKFHEYLSSIKPILTNCDIFYNPSRGLGCKLTSDAPIGTTVLEISNQYVITSLHPFPLSPYLQNFSNDEILIARILYEKFLGSRGNLITEYIHTLPVQGIKNPVLWTPDHINTFQKYKPLEINISDLIPDLSVPHSRYLSAVQPLQNIPKGMLELDAFKWAYSILSSRSFKVSLEAVVSLYPTYFIPFNVRNQVYVSILIPVLDLINHCPLPPYIQPIIPLKLNSSSQTIELVTDRNQTAGQELVNFYGMKNNLEHIQAGGFVVKRNPYEYFYISASSSSLCYGYKMDEQCIYRMFPYSLNSEYLQYLRESASGVKCVEFSDMRDLVNYYGDLPEYARRSLETRSTMLGAVRRYRITLDKSPDWVVPLRQVRRDAAHITEDIDRMIMDYAVWSRVSALKHISHVERLLLRLLYKSLL